MRATGERDSVISQIKLLVSMSSSMTIFVELCFHAMINVT